MPRKRQTFSVSGSSSELRHHIQFSAVKKDCRPEVVPVSEAAGGTLDDLDFAVQPLCRRVRYAVHDCRPDPGPMAFQRQSGFSNWFQAGMRGMPEPFFEVCVKFGFFFGDLPKTSEQFLDFPCSCGWSGDALCFLEPAIES